MIVWRTCVWFTMVSFQLAGAQGISLPHANPATSHAHLGLLYPPNYWHHDWYSTRQRHRGPPTGGSPHTARTTQESRYTVLMVQTYPRFAADRDELAAGSVHVSDTPAWDSGCNEVPGRWESLWPPRTWSDVGVLPHAVSFHTLLQVHVLVRTIGNEIILFLVPFFV